MFDKLKKIKTLPNKLRASVKILKDSRVPALQKGVFLFLVLGYFVWPYDLVFDIPLMGQLDDLGVFFFLLSIFMSFVPENIKNDHGWRQR